MAERAQQAGGIQSPHSWFQGGHQPSLRLGGILQISPWQAHSLLQTALNRTRVQGHHPSSCWATHLTWALPPADCRAQMCFVSKRGDKIWSCIWYTGLQWILRISYSHQRCIFHPGTRSRHINPTAHHTFTVFKIRRWSMCRRFYEQEMQTTNRRAGTTRVLPAKALNAGKKHLL